jgi:hypothetical protein
MIDTPADLLAVHAARIALLKTAREAAADAERRTDA